MAEKRLRDSALFWLYFTVWGILVVLEAALGPHVSVLRPWGIIAVVFLSPIALPIMIFTIWGIGGLLILPILQFIPLVKKASVELRALIHEMSTPKN